MTSITPATPVALIDAGPVDLPAAHLAERGLPFFVLETGPMAAGEGVASSCCAPAVQATCCEPEAKADCCGVAVATAEPGATAELVALAPKRGTSCGCQ
jgi:hypothetical protein